MEYNKRYVDMSPKYDARAEETNTSLSDILHAILDYGKSMDVKEGRVYSTSDKTNPDLWRSVAAVKNMRAAERAIDEFHNEPPRYRGDYPFTKGGYPPYSGFPEEFNPVRRNTNDMTRGIGSLSMDADTGFWNNLGHEDAKQVLLGIAESQHQNRNKDVNRGSMGRPGSESPRHDMEITIKKKMHKEDKGKINTDDPQGPAGPMLRPRKVSPMGG